MSPPKFARPSTQQLRLTFVVTSFYLMSPILLSLESFAVGYADARLLEFGLVRLARLGLLHANLLAALQIICTVSLTFRHTGCLASSSATKF